MKNAGTVLLYNCSAPEFSKLKQIFAMLRLRMRVVEPDRYHVPLEELAVQVGGGSPAPEVPVDPKPAETAEALPEPMLVFCGLGQALLNQVLEVIRLAKLPPIPLKAVLTDTNQAWNTVQLHEELLREREAIAAQKAEKT